EHGHEVRLAGPEAAVQVGGLRVASLDGPGDEAERVVERGCDLRCDLVALDGRGRLVLGDAGGQLEDEVPVADLGGDVEDLTDEGHAVLVERAVWPAGPARPEGSDGRAARASLPRCKYVVVVTSRGGWCQDTNLGGAGGSRVGGLCLTFPGTAGRCPRTPGGASPRGSRWLWPGCRARRSRPG